MGSGDAPPQDGPSRGPGGGPLAPLRVAARALASAAVRVGGGLGGRAGPSRDARPPRGDDHDDEAPGRLARTVVALRVPLLIVWVLGAAAATFLLPPPGGGAGVSGLVPEDAPAIRTEQDAFAEFGFPLIARTMVVQRDPDGLDAQDYEAAARAAARALRDEPDPEIAYALPIPNVPQLAPAARERNTTIVTYLYFRQGVGGEARRELAQRHAELVDRLGGDVVGVTGAIPGRQETGDLILERLTWVELGSAAVVMLVIGVAFRSLAAPLLVLGIAGIAYLVALRTVGALGSFFGVPTPSELEPLIIVLLLGVVADYSVFLLTGARRRLLEGDDPRRAAAATLDQYGPVITVAAFTVAAGTAALLVADLEFARALGPGMAITTLVALAVTATCLPAAVALLGRRALWPAVRGEVADKAKAVSQRQERPPWRERLTRVLVRRRVAVPVAIACVAALGVGALGLSRSDLGFTFISGLPAGSDPREAAEAAGAGFAPGVVAPVSVLVEGDGLDRRDEDLSELAEGIRAAPGVAAVIGPGSIPADADPGALITQDGSAARLLVVLGEDPYADEAIDDIGVLRARLPILRAQAGLSDATVRLAGDTALAAQTIDLLRGDLLRVGAVVLALDLVILVIFLRALVAPLVILASSALAVACALGMAAWIFTGPLGAAAITFYMPLAVAVLLLSLGSDYNVFLAGRIWQEAEDRPIREAILVAAPGTARAISVAGVALAGSFALLAIVPLQSFRSFALAMAAGVLIDTFIVRLLLMPSALSLLGRASGWPGRRARKPGGAPGSPRAARP